MPFLPTCYDRPGQRALILCRVQDFSRDAILAAMGDSKRLQTHRWQQPRLAAAALQEPNRLGSIGPPQHYEISSRLGSLGLPQPLEISSRLSGTSALQSRGAFRQLQAHSFAYPTIPKSHSHRPSWVSSRNRVLTPGRAVRCRGPLGPSFFHKVGTLNAPSGLRTRGAPWKCFPQVC